MTLPGAQSPVGGHEFLVLFENWADAALGATAAATSTAEGSDEPFIDPTPEKLLSADLSTAWRSGSLLELALAASGAGRSQATVEVTLGLGGPRSVDWVGLHRHNVLVPWRLELYRGDPAAGAAAAYASPWTDPIVRAAVRDFRFRSLFFPLGPTPGRVARMASLYRLDSFVYAGAPVHGVRHLKLVFDVTRGANGAKDYLQIALPMVGRIYRPEINVVLGWKVAPGDPSEVRRTEGGSKRGRRRRVRRTLSFDLGYLDRDQAFRRILTDWLVAHGVLDLSFVWPEPAHRQFFYDQAVLGQLAETAMPSVAMAALEVPDARGFSVEDAD